MAAGLREARTSMRRTLMNAGLKPGVAAAIAKGYDPALMEPQRYLGRVLNGVERALDAQPVSACERIARTA